MKFKSSKSKNIPIRYMIPNAITLLALGSGLTSIRMAYEQRFELTIYAIIFAAILDGLDGRAARLLKASSKFGAELDSLSDFVNFGVAPGIIIYFWSLKELKSLGWIIAMTYAVCICLRLARFNVETEEENRSPWKKKFFQGIPAPAAAGLLLMPFYTRFIELDIYIPSLFIMIYTVIVSLLAASSIPTFSFKKMGTIPRRNVRAGLVLVIIVASVLATYTWETLIVFGFIYLGTIPLSMYKYAGYEKLEKQGKLAHLSEDDDSDDEDLEG